jgi:small-conductance mechanosensitive channel
MKKKTDFVFTVVVLFTLLMVYWQPVLSQTKDSTTIAPKETLQLTKIDSAATVLKNAVEADTAQSDNGKRESFKPPELSEVISVSNIVWTVITLVIGFLIINLVLNLLNNIARRNKKREFTIKRMIPIIRILSWVFLIYIIIVGIFSPPAATVFAFFASVGVAVGFASQDLLKNVFGGLVVMFDRPFQIGDKIEAGKYYGEVIEIGIRSTKVVTPDDSVVTIPNSEFMMQYVSNSNSGENNCQVVAEIYLPINVDTERVRQIATEAALVSKYIYLNKPVVVLFFNEFKDRSSVLKMRLKAYVSTLDKEFVFKSEMTELVIKELVKSNIIKHDPDNGFS